MVQEITIEVSDLHAEMMDEVKVKAANQDVRQSTENFIHQLYQQVQQAEAQQQALNIEETVEQE